MAAELPEGWDGRIRERQPAGTGVGAASASGRVYGRLHAASFRLPDDIGDYGSNAVERMAGSDIFVALLEFGPEAIGTALFVPGAVPRRVRPDHFDPRTLQRPLAGQSGFQRFFSTRARAFCLYVVLGSHRRRAVTVPTVNDVLASLVID